MKTPVLCNQRGYLVAIKKEDVIFQERITKPLKLLTTSEQLVGIRPKIERTFLIAFSRAASDSIRSSCFFPCMEHSETDIKKVMIEVP